ncbi:SP_1767 family glycosyltransferase [Cytobacillus firmus]|uniref:SP_1767 family glycosyltransferase n=1 Tax=Cytobacillus firmus TaxID=1399 RepID=UPI0020306091|nr:SP_1767 family glycosyltransferase [Cytobacillus firmus]URT70208.1 SP_1767 family glycosyltransferase [Cytobacillus firmus]
MKKFILLIYNKFVSAKGNLMIFFNKVIARIIPRPMVKTTDETLTKLINGSFSMSRFGDGEFGLMQGKSLLFQPYSKELSQRLKQIIKSNNKQHLVCIPNVFDNVDWCTENSKTYWIKYLNRNRSKIYKIIGKRKQYYDSLVTRLYIDHKDKSNAEERFRKFKKLWTKREIVIVEGDKSRLGIGNDLFHNAKSMERIICPSTNAFDKYEEIFEEVKNQNRSKLILIALGPTATVLAYDLSLLGYQAIDIGHIDIEYEWFLQKATEKRPIQNKYIGEIPNGTVVNDINDEKYESEILTRVG